MDSNALTPPIESSAPRLREVSLRSEASATPRDASALATGESLDGATRAEPSETAATAESVREAVQRLDEHGRRSGHGLRFSMDDSTGRVVVKVIDADTEKVIRQVPPEEVLELARRFQGQEGSIVNLEI